MPFRFTSEHLRHAAELWLERAGDHEGQLEALVAAADGDLRQAEAALSQAADDLDARDVRRLLSGHLERSAARAAAATRLLAAARQQRAAACRLMDDLDGSRSARDESTNAVLVVDDHGDVRDAVAGILQDAGFLVRTASNGLEALIAAYEIRPHIILMDVSMPVLDGVEATRLIKAGETTRDARVIAYTGNPSFDDSPTRTLFAAVLTKPATPDAVLAAVRHTAGL